MIGYLQRRAPPFKLGNIWQADELFVKARRKGVRNKWAYLWVVLGRQTHTITTYLTRHREAKGFEYCLSTHWMKLRMQDWLRLWTGEYGLILVTDGARAYSKGLRKWKLPARHIRAHISGPLVADVEDGDGKMAEAFGGRVTNNAVEGLNSQLRSWVRSFRGIKGVFGGRTWALWYELCHNFLEPQEVLGGRTAAEAAGVKLELGQQRWAEVMKRAMGKVQL